MLKQEKKISVLLLGKICNNIATFNIGGIVKLRLRKVQVSKREWNSVKKGIFSYTMAN